MTTDTTLPGTTSTLFNVPKLAEDGSNWITYKERTLTAISARGLMRYVDGRAVEPLPYAISTLTGLLEKPDGSNLVKQQVFSTITDRLLLRVQKLESASEVWAEICQIHEDKTELVQIDFAEMLRLRELLAGMGAGILDTDFHAMILGSLPESYRPLLSSINAASKITKTPLSSERRPNKKGGSALVAREAKGKGRASSSTSKANSDITCFNCDRKGHYKTDCWRPGGGKEGQGPNQQWKKADKGQKQTANAAAESSDPPEHFAVEKRGAIMDSGATSHFCPDRSKFSNFVTIPPQKIHTADGSTLDAIGRGDVDIDLRWPSHSYPPLGSHPLASLSFSKAACARSFRRDLTDVSLPKSLKWRAVNELHRILGHVSQTAVLDAVKNGLVTGVELDTTSKPEFCDVYGELVHTDLWGPAQTMSIAGALYAFKAYEAWLARQSPGVRLCKVRSDRGGEYPSRMG